MGERRVSHASQNPETDAASNNPGAAATSRIQALGAAFRRTGDPAAALSAAAAPSGDRALIGLQGLLAAAKAGREREVVEDVGLALIGGATVSAQNIDAVASVAASIAGEHAKQFIDIPAVAEALIRLCGENVPNAALVMGVLHALEEAVGNRITCEPSEIGKKIYTYGTHCETCGGEAKGQGHVVCSLCLEKAKRDFRSSQVGAQQRSQADSRTWAQLETKFAAMLLRQNASDYGCPDCANAPVKPCDCQTVYPIPMHVADGQVIPGRRPADGAEAFAFVRLQDEK